MANTIIKHSTKFWESFKEYRITADQLAAFENAKKSNPLQAVNKKDYKYKGNGPLGLSGLSHARIGPDLYIIYRLGGQNPTVIYEYGFTNHEDSGTGNPPKPKQQATFVTRMNNLTF